MCASGTEERCERPDHEGAAHESTVRRVAAASFLGNFIEWFDYGSYGFLALVLARVIFPSSDPQVALLETFGVFALSFLLRPIGALVWGHLGDRRGRRWALTWSIVLMSGATFGIGLIPSYEKVGLLAPILLLLLRMVQGFSASGEYAGAATFLAEYAPPRRRGMFVSLVPASTAAGLLTASILVTAMHVAFTNEFLDDWGWRIPFLIGGALGIVARHLLLGLEDSPVYAQMVSKMAAAAKPVDDARRPLTALFTDHWRALAISFGVAALNAVAFYLLLGYLPTYLSEEVKLDTTEAFIVSIITLSLYIVSIFVMGHISDRLGRKRMLIIACVGFVLLSVPLFTLFAGTGLVVIVLAQSAFCLMLTINDGTLATYLVETFPTRVRYTGFALSFNLANAIFGGTAPLVATWLIRWTGDKLAPAYYLSFVALLALGAMIASKEHSGEDLNDDGARDE